MRKLSIFFLIIFSVRIYSYENVEYKLDFLGIMPGKTTYQEVVSKRKDYVIEYNGYTYFVKYKRYWVTFNSRKDKVNTIIIFDPDFVDVNGIRIGDTLTSVAYEFPCFVYHSGWAADLIGGVTYHIEDNRIARIVYSFRSGFEPKNILLADPSYLRRCDQPEKYLEGL